MAVTLNILRDNKGARHRRMRVGRGIGSGKGKTCGRGGKGQTARSGVTINGFEGGQTPIYRRLPKRGFVNTRRTEYLAVNVSLIDNFIQNKRIDASKTINGEVLLQAGVISNLNRPLKLLAKGELKSKINIEVQGASKSAVAAVEKAGGKVTIVAAKKATASEENSKSEKKASKKKTDSGKKTAVA